MNLFKLFYLLPFLALSNQVYCQSSNQNVHNLSSTEKSYEIIWDTRKFESPSVYRDLNTDELNYIESYRLENEVNIIYLNDLMNVKIFPKNKLIKE